MGDSRLGCPVERSEVLSLSFVSEAEGDPSIPAEIEGRGGVACGSPLDPRRA